MDDDDEAGDTSGVEAAFTLPMGVNFGMLTIDLPPPLPAIPMMFNLRPPVVPVPAPLTPPAELAASAAVSA